MSEGEFFIIVIGLICNAVLTIVWSTQITSDIKKLQEKNDE